MATKVESLCGLLQHCKATLISSVLFIWWFWPHFLLQYCTILKTLSTSESILKSTNFANFWEDSQESTYTETNTKNVGPFSWLLASKNETLCPIYRSVAIFRSPHFQLFFLFFIYFIFLIHYVEQWFAASVVVVKFMAYRSPRVEVLQLWDTTTEKICDVP